MIIKQICFHFSHDVKEGQYQRIRKLQNDIHLLTGSCYQEFQVVGLQRFLCRPVSCLCAVAAVPGGRKTVLPVLLPGDRRIKAIRKFNKWVSMTVGAVIGFALKPNICIGETHRSYAALRGVKAGCPSTQAVFDIHGAYPEEVAYCNGNRRWVAPLVADLEDEEGRMVRFAEGIVAQSEAMFTHLETKHSRVIPRRALYQCGVDLERFRFMPEARHEIREEFGIGDDDLVFVYLGGLHRWQLVGEACAIFSQFIHCHPEKKAVFLFLTSEDPDRVMDSAKRYDIPADVLLIRSVPHLQVSRYLSACDMGFLLREDTVLNRVACPTKLGEYLACGLPVITSEIAKHWSWTKGENEAICKVNHNNSRQAAEEIATFLSVRGWQIPKRTRDACCALAQRTLSAKSDFDNLLRLFQVEQQ